MLNKGYRYSKAQALANYYADVRNTANFGFRMPFGGPQGPGGGLARIEGMRYGSPTMAEQAANVNRQQELIGRRRAWNTIRRDPRARAQAMGIVGGAALGAGALGAGAGYLAGRNQEDEQY